MSAAMIAAACGAAGTEAPELGGQTDDPAPTVEVEGPEMSSVADNAVDELDPEAEYERLLAETDPLLPDGGKLAMCDDVEELEATIEGDLGTSQSMHNDVRSALVDYWMGHLDTFGGMWIDRDHGGTIVLTFTDDPEPHRRAITELVDITIDVLQVPFSEVNLIATQDELGRLMGPEFGLFSMGFGTLRNRVELDLTDPPDGALDALAELVPTAAVCVTTSFSPEPPSGPLQVIPDTERDDPLVSCSGVPPVPYSVLINPPLIETVDHPAVDALREALDAPPAEPLPTGDWAVIAIEEDRATFAALSSDGFGTARFDRRGEVWVLTGWGYDGSCDPLVALPEGLGQVVITLDPDSLPQPSDTVIDLLVTELDCASGRQMGDALLGPQVVETDALVLVAFAVVPVFGGAECPGNPSTSVSIELSAPLGNRIIADGLSVPPQPLTDEPY